jgi:hypothetical protein
MLGRGIRRYGTALGAVALTGALAPAIAQADTTTPTWNCRASIAYVKNSILPGPLARIEPLAANGITTDPAHPDQPYCADDSQSVPHISTPDGPIKVDADAVKAVTILDPDVAAARDQTATAAVAAADAVVNLSGVKIEVGAILSTASVKCVAGVPTFSRTSSVATISVNGQSVPVDSTLTQISTVVNGSPLSALIKLTVNQAEIVGDANGDTQSVAQQALKVELLSLTGAPMATAVLGEAKVTRQGRTCDGTTTPPDTTGSPNNPPTTTTTTTPGTPVSPSIIYVPVPNGNSNTGSSGTPTTIQLNGANGGCGKLSMYFVPTRKKVFSSTYGNRVVTRGRIVSCGGKSIVGGRIDVFHVIRGKKVRIRKTGIRSRALGRLTLILPLNLTSRKIIFEYRGNLASNKVTSRVTLDLTVRYKGKVITKDPGPKRTVQF